MKVRIPLPFTSYEIKGHDPGSATPAGTRQFSLGVLKIKRKLPEGGDNVAPAPRLPLPQLGDPWISNSILGSLPACDMRTLDPTQLVQGDKLGEGAQGVVHRARYQGRASVMKYTKRPATSVQKEAAANRQVITLAGPHRNIARYRGDAMQAVEGRTRHILVFDHVDGPDGTSLLKRLDEAARRGDLDAGQRELVARFVTARMADAARHCNRAGVVHCDIKTQNILFDMTTGEPVLIDFGCAQLRNQPRQEWLAADATDHPFSRNDGHDAVLLAALAVTMSGPGSDASPGSPLGQLVASARQGISSAEDSLGFMRISPDDEAEALSLIKSLIRDPDLSPASSRTGSFDLFD